MRTVSHSLRARAGAMTGSAVEAIVREHVDPEFKLNTATTKLWVKFLDWTIYPLIDQYYPSATRADVGAAFKEWNKWFEKYGEIVAVWLGVMKHLNDMELWRYTAAELHKSYDRTQPNVSSAQSLRDNYPPNWIAPPMADVPLRGEIALNCMPGAMGEVVIYRSWLVSGIEPGEHEDGIKRHPSYAKYLEWSSNGNLPPPIEIIWNSSSSGRKPRATTGRRRLLVAKQLGGGHLPGWVSGWSIQHRSIVVDALRAGKPVPARVLASVGRTELAQGVVRLHDTMRMLDYDKGIPYGWTPLCDDYRRPEFGDVLNRSDAWGNAAEVIDGAEAVTA